MSDGTSWLGLALGLLFASPWIAASIWFWSRRVRDGALPPSLGDELRRRLLG